MKVFITGVEGFVGKYLARHLASSGFEVHGSYHSDKPDVEGSLCKLDILDKDALPRLLEKLQPAYIFHLAAISSVRQSIEEPQVTRAVNVTGTKNLLDAAKLLQLDCRLLLVSSAEVYGKPQKIPITEDHPLKPLNPYAKSKLEMEKLAQEYDLDYVISRSFTHTGPGQSANFFCSEFAKTIAEIEKGLRPAVLTYGDAEIVRDLTDVRDMVRAYQLLLDKGKGRGIYNICSGRGVAISQVLEILTRQSSAKIALKQDKSKVAKNSIRTMVGSCEKFQQISKWKPTVEIEQTLQDMLSYWRLHV
jgi:GDP-4-dehydro-6-deoxy-D-mannose reductase